MMKNSLFLLSIHIQFHCDQQTHYFPIWEGLSKAEKSGIGRERGSKIANMVLLMVSEIVVGRERCKWYCPYRGREMGNQVEKQRSWYFFSITVNWFILIRKENRLRKCLSSVKGISRMKKEQWKIPQDAWKEKIFGKFRKTSKYSKI